MKEFKEMVIESLEKCSSLVCNDECPYFGCDDCVEVLMQGALAVIRQLSEGKSRAVVLDKGAVLLSPEAAAKYTVEAIGKDKPSEDDPVNHPSHYTQGGVECIDAIKAATTGLVGFEGYCTGNIIKYLWRWKHKNGLEDLRKAGWYLGALIGSKEG